MAADEPKNDNQYNICITLHNKSIHTQKQPTKEEGVQKLKLLVST